MTEELALWEVQQGSVPIDYDYRHSDALTLDMRMRRLAIAPMRLRSAVSDR
ncbi:MAG: hypothetical protein N838_10250 [Thiohalocapsa sp. PB-PSB1]|nr:MAG: hypothetical protein N838_10250 [Thiohalocapsa sp. PB-PSB1]